MQQIDIQGFEVALNVVGYLIGKPEEIEKYPLKDDQRLKPLGIKPGDALLLWYKDSSDHDDDHKAFKVQDWEKAFAIIKSDDFSNVYIGQKLFRVMESLDEGKPWISDAVVTDITDTKIICTVDVDVPRTMEFDRKTGISIDGRDYGWIQRNA
ncbi:MAG: hypothetical protein WAX66_03560 [Patescibacteria group bacterium]